MGSGGEKVWDGSARGEGERQQLDGWRWHLSYFGLRRKKGASGGRERHDGCVGRLGALTRKGAGHAFCWAGSTTPLLETPGQIAVTLILLRT
jgi:hypothetical protein